MAITPETKIGDFLAAHPDQQEALIARVPEFARLRNPVLRRTVAKLATVEHAARMAGLPTAELVRGRKGGPVPDLDPQTMSTGTTFDPGCGPVALG